MKTVRVISISLLAVSLLLANGIGLSSGLNEQLLKCNEEPDAEKRLACYDAITEKLLAKNRQFIQPDSKFLNSRLVVEPWVSDFNLTIQDFVGLINNAVMDDGRKVVVQGWRKEGKHYVLRIIMRSAVQLKFLPSEPKADEIPMSLLLSPIVDGQPTDPELFVITIASMVPDENENPE